MERKAVLHIKRYIFKTLFSLFLMHELRALETITVFSKTNSYYYQYVYAPI